MKTRFAPSPTGYLHLGNIRTALLCFLYARKEGGEFILRLDDTDTERSTSEYAEAIKEDLEWLGITPDRVVKQSERFSKYDAAVERLKEAGKLYPCFETQEELEIKRKMQLGRGQPPIYDRAALKLGEEQIAEKIQAGQQPHWRFKLDQEAVVEWNDEVRGAQRFEMKHMSDPILVRENGMYTYMLPSTVDDIDMDITHVLRGEDHVSNTAIQLQLFDALGGNRPVFAHNALLKSKEGKLSKRSGSLSVQELRKQGLEPITLTSFLARIGTYHNVELAENLQTLVEEFDITAYSKAQTSYSKEDIFRLNTKLLHQMPYAEIKPHLDELGYGDVDEAFWNVARRNIENLEDLRLWLEICHNEIEPEIEDEAYAQQLAETLPEGALDETTWDRWVTAVKGVSGRKGKALFMPIRKALTGMEHGPELKDLLPLIGREKIIARLQGKTA